MIIRCHICGREFDKPSRRNQHVKDAHNTKEPEMTTIPALGADKATDERALFEADTPGFNHLRYESTGAYVSDAVEFYWLGWQSGRTSLAAVPASEPVGDEQRKLAARKTDWCPHCGQGWGCAVREAEYRHKLEALSCAAPAPVSGMPDLASLPVYERMARGRQDLRMEPFYAAADVERLLNPIGETK